MPSPSVLLSNVRSLENICICMTNNWCNNAVRISSHCSPDDDLLTVQCRPFYLHHHHNYGSLHSPSASTKDILNVLYLTIAGLQNTHPAVVFIVAGDFNQANMKKVLAHFHQDVDFANRGNNTPSLL